MKKTRAITIIVSLLLLCAMTLNMTGCSFSIKAEDLMEGVSANKITAIEGLNGESAIITDFAVRLFKASEELGEDGNTLISPLSVLCALAMTANGAEEETLRQMEQTLGMSVDDLNLYLYSYINALPQGEKYKLNLANSIWFTDHERFTVNRDFLQTNADYYGADIYKAPFDKTTLKDINRWVKEKTDGMIPEVLDEIPEVAIMYLINALAFDAEWTEIYEDTQISDGEFTTEGGEKQKVEFMYCGEGKYLDDGKATGFIKYYSGRKYAFAAMLPNEDISVSDYIASLDGAALNQLLSNPQNTAVKTAIPKFETEYDIEMSEVLKSLGMVDAFEPDIARFGGLGVSEEDNIYIGRVLHKTFISVGERGTKAGAVTVVEMVDNASADISDPKKVYLDRPFVYMLIDCETNIPFFIGVMESVK